jgi:N-acetylmuramoyl-L-alanine amidase
LRGVGLPPLLVDRTLEYSQDVVRQIRIGRHPNDTVRVVLDAEGVTRHSVFTLYNPFRLVVDCERPLAEAQLAAAPAPSAPAPLPIPKTSPPRSVETPGDSTPTGPSAMPAPAPAPSPVPSRDTVTGPSPSPTPPSANAAGGFSMARQLGLGVSRIVIDPGHGGRDPGAQVRGLNEADLTLDVALRLEKLLRAEPGVEVVLTRRTDVYVALEERTAIANREHADLFLSIHANASRNTAARGVETYYLSFASSPEAEAVAARENAGSDGAMRNLPDIIRAITLNNKLDESRDFAAMVQQSLVSRLRRVNSGVRDLGVKKAPFVVLIGAGMPSVLAEVSFLTHRQDAQLLKTSSYRQRIAEALHGAVMRYRRALKGQSLVAEQ